MGELPCRAGMEECMKKKWWAAALAALVVWGGWAESFAWAQPPEVAELPGDIGGSEARLILVEPQAVAPEILTAGGGVAADMAAKDIISQAEKTKGVKALAAVNGTYFNAGYKAAAEISYPNNCARVYGTLLRGGRLINGGGTGEEATLGFTPEGKPLIDWVSMTPQVTFSGETVSDQWPEKRRQFQVTPWGLNNYSADPSAIMQFTDEMTLAVTVPNGSKLVYIADGKVMKLAPGGTFRVPKGSDVLVYNPAAAAAAEKWGKFPALGDSAEISVVKTPRILGNQGQWSGVGTALSAGPMLLKGGRNVVAESGFSQPKQGTDGANRKSFAAVMKDGRLLLGVSNASLNQIASELAGLGALDALSLDGGESSMLYTAQGGFLQPAGRKLTNLLVFLEKSPEGYTPFSNPKEKASDFKDIKGHWGQAYIKKAMDKGMFSGISESAFGPEKPMTRAMLAAALGRLSGEAGDSALPAGRFDDVSPARWYAPYVAWVVEKGIASGTGEKTFSPDAPVTREQLCVMLDKYMEIKGSGRAADGTGGNAANGNGNGGAGGANGGTGRSAGNEARFNDDGKISDWAKDAVYKLKKAGAVNGYKDRSFRPQNQVTRAEAAAILAQALL